MTFETIENVLNINTDAIMTLAMAAVLLVIGYFIKNKLTILDRYCIPAPVVGGFLFMFITWIGHATGSFTFNFTNTFQDPFMLAFFTTVGLGASFALLKKGGVLLIVYWLTCGVISIFQNTIGIGISKVIGLEAPYALLSSSISMIGGPGTAAGIGPDLDAAGAIGGTTVAVAAATFGLIFGSLLGGPIARKLIVKNHLRDELAEQVEEEDADDAHYNTHANNFVYGFLLLVFCVGVGNFVSVWLTKICGFSFPIYIGSMLVAVIVRNVIDHFKIMEFPSQEIGTMGNMFLAIFLSMALSGLKLWQLVDLALPMIVALAAEVLLMVVFSLLVVFPVMGRDYDAAMITAGFIGFGMGATSNAMANMQAVSRRYGPSPSAYFVIPMVGGLFNDFFNAAIIAFGIGLLS